MSITQVEGNRVETFVPHYGCAMPGVLSAAQFVLRRGELVRGCYLYRVILELTVQRVFLRVRNPYLMEEKYFG